MQTVFLCLDAQFLYPRLMEDQSRLPNKLLPDGFGFLPPKSLLSCLRYMFGQVDVEPMWSFSCHF